MLPSHMNRSCARISIHREGDRVAQCDDHTSVRLHGAWLADVDDPRSPTVRFRQGDPGQVGVEPVERHDAENEQDDAYNYPPRSRSHRQDGTPPSEVEARIRRVHPGEVGDDSHHGGDSDYEPADACHRSGCDPADESTTHQPDCGPNRKRERAGLPPEDLVVRDVTAPTPVRLARARHVEVEHVHHGDDTPEDRSDENEQQDAAGHEAKRSARKGAGPFLSASTRARAVSRVHSGAARKYLRIREGRNADSEPIVVRNRPGLRDTSEGAAAEPSNVVEQQTVLRRGQPARRSVPRSNVRNAHSHSSHHRADILASEQCGCFYCGAIFPPSRIDVWAHEPPPPDEGEGQTAMCPECGIDSVLGDRSGFPITPEFLKRMNVYWF